MSTELCFASLILAPLAGVFLYALAPHARTSPFHLATGSGLYFLCSLLTFVKVMRTGPLQMAGGFFQIDMLSALHLLLVAAVFTLAACFAIPFFATPDPTHPAPHPRRFGLLWFTFLETMTLVLIANNLGMMWVALEATTLASAFLILTSGNQASVEAMWKYLLICSVGIAFALIGTLLLSAAARQAAGGGEMSLLWTELRAGAHLFDRRIMLAAFVFVLIGFGTKAGIAPMHTWLPDAHSQAPAPVSAVFSGVMLSTALYCVMRYLPLARAACGHDRRIDTLLIVFGLLSVAAATVFIPSQRDVKRMLAYCSVEHIGLITLGLGLGGLGGFAALLHTVNHATAKALAFFCAGRIGQCYHSHDMTVIRGSISVAPVNSIGLFVALLALIGMAPFSIFISELQLLRAAILNRHWITLVACLAGCSVIFISMLRFALSMTLGSPPQSPGQPVRSPRSHTIFDAALVGVLITILVILGLWLPDWLHTAITQAAALLEAPL